MIARILTVLTMLFATPAMAAPDWTALLETLNRAQDDLAHIGASAQPVHTRVLSIIDGHLEEAAERGEAVPTDVATRYALSGGTPTLAAAVLSRVPDTARDAVVARAALAYIAGETAEANRLFSMLDPTHLPGRLGALVAMARGTLAARSDEADTRSSADDWLSFVRLAAPGTLIEEAALRRQADLALGVEEPASEAFWRFSRHYWRRFPDSAFRDEMRELTLAAMLREPDAARLEHLLNALAAVPLPIADEMIRQTVRHAALDGNGDLGRALLAAHPSSDEQDAALLGGLMEFVDLEPDAMMARLEVLAGLPMEPRDAALVTAAQAVADAMLFPIEQPGPGASAALDPGFPDLQGRLATIDKVLVR